jgi:hypothetical protein
MIATDVIGFEMLAIRNRWDGRSSSPVDRSAVPYPSAKTSRSSREIATVSPGIPYWFVYPVIRLSSASRSRPESPSASQIPAYRTGLPASVASSGPTAWPLTSTGR